MAASLASRRRTAQPVRSHAAEESQAAKWILIALMLGFIGLFLVVPLVAVFVEAFRKGVETYAATFSDSAAAHAVRLTLLTALIAVPLNTAFGLAAAWAITKFQFKGKNILITLIDLPFAVSPVISGLVFVLIFGNQGWMPQQSLGEYTAPVMQMFWWARDWPLAGPLIIWLEDPKILFAVPGIVLATCFVTFPFVARELIPLMQSQGSAEEQAALTLGATGWQTFWRVTLPNIKWGLLHGVILCNARAMGEFGAVSVVSGHIRGQTNTIPLHIEILYNEYMFSASFAMASLLTLLALVTLVIKVFVESRHHQEEA
jgi:sulfate transport system permease protein